MRRALTLALCLWGRLGAGLRVLRGITRPPGATYFTCLAPRVFHLADVRLICPLVSTTLLDDLREVVKVGVPETLGGADTLLRVVLEHFFQ